MSTSTSAVAGQSVRTRSSRGFTLVELVSVLVILGTLVSVALPRFLDLRSQARVNAVEALAGVIRTAANQGHAACAIAPSCGLDTPESSLPTVQVEGFGVQFASGWPAAHGDGIARLINIQGFTKLPYVANSKQLVFVNDSAQDPNTCSVLYSVHPSVATKPLVSTTLSGC